MRKGKTFDEYCKEHPPRTRPEPADPSPYGVRGVYEDDALFILRASGRAQPIAAPAAKPAGPPKKKTSPEVKKSHSPKKSLRERLLELRARVSK